MRLIGLDPGLQRTGWGIVEAQDNRLRHVDSGVVATEAGAPMAARLGQLFEALQTVIARFAPCEAAVEEVFVNKNPESTLKLGQARGVVLLAPALCGLPVHEYAARLVKKAVVGTGRADKTQIQAMVRMLLPGAAPASADAADALAVAICHAHHAAQRRLAADAATERAAPGRPA